MDYVDIQAVESKLTDVTVTPIPMIKNAHSNHNTGSTSNSSNYGGNHTANITITPQVNHRSSSNSNNSNHHHHHHHSGMSAAVNDGSSGALALTVGTNHNNSNNSSSNNNNNNSSSSNSGGAANLVAPVTTFNQFPNNAGLSKYAQLLMVIEEMGRDLRPTYSGSRNSAERLKRLIVHARILVRECLVETERSARQ